MKVLIVGGSVAGLSCAIQLRKAGVDIDVVEIDPEWRAYGAGLTVTGPTLRALREIGVLDEVVASGATWDAIKVHDGGGKQLQQISFPPMQAGLPATGGVMRPLLHKILSRQTVAAGARVRLGASVAAIVETEDAVTATFSDGRTQTYDLLIGADGIYSSIRKLQFPQAPKPRFTGQVIFRLVAERPAGFDCTHIFLGSDIKVGFNPVSATHMYMFLLCRPRGADPWIAPEEQPQRLYELMAGFGGFVPDIRATVRTTNVNSINYRPLEVILMPTPWHTRRTVLIGDAAHATTPHLASGAGMAMEDAIVLSQELTAAPGDPQQAFARFMARRFDRCRLVVENSVQLGELEMHGGSASEHARVMTEANQVLRQPI